MTNPAAFMNSHCRTALLTCVSLIATYDCGLFADTVRVDDARQLASAVARAKPGDEILLASKQWRDVDIVLIGEGEPARPIVVRAEQPGQTVITGSSRVRIAGKHLVLSGLKFHNLNNPKSDWLEFRKDSKASASYCRVENCWFVEDDESESLAKENRWINLYGEHNAVERCSIAGKRNKGATLVVWVDDKNTGAHTIRENYFGPRPSLKKNGGETIRIGDSSTSQLAARCIVEKNLFHLCAGETECISNKSCENVYRQNTFRDVEGTLTLRHGDRCVVEGNVFVRPPEVGNRRHSSHGNRPSSKRQHTRRTGRRRLSISNHCYPWSSERCRQRLSTSPRRGYRKQSHQ